MIRRFDGPHALLHFAHFMEQQVAVNEAAVATGARITADVLHRNAIKAFGDTSKLAPLAQSTQDERVRLGFSPDEPLLRDGTLLRDHIEKEHTHDAGGIGSNEQVQVYHETGYVNARTGTLVPPRPVMKIALEESLPTVAGIARAIAQTALGFGAPSLTGAAETVPEVLGPFKPRP